MAKRELIGNELHVGSWVYYAPAAKADEAGKTVIARVKDTASGEIYELFLNENDDPYESRYQDGESSPKRVLLHLEPFAEKLIEFRQAVAGTDADEWNRAYDDAFKRASLAFARKIRVEPEKNPVVASFTVYDMSMRGAKPAPTRPFHGDVMRLEKYYFNRRKDGSYELAMQEGWNAGSHWDGGTAVREIPSVWLKLSWNGFLKQFCARFPESEYFLGINDLYGAIGLREFLGIPD